MIYTRTDPETKTVYIIWQCPDCTWYRCRTRTPEWERTVIDHPVYGNTSNYNAYMNDVNLHNCEETRKARIRHGFDCDRRLIPERPKRNGKTIDLRPRTRMGH